MLTVEDKALQSQVERILHSINLKKHARLDAVEVGVDVVDIRVNTLLQRRHLAEMCFALFAGSHQKLCIAVRLERFEGGHRETLLHFRNT